MYKVKTYAIFLILIIGTMSITTTFLSQNIYAISILKKSTGITISQINTNPLVVHKQNNFKITATIINNSPNTIKFVGPVCGNSPLTTTFNKNVNVHPSGINKCNAIQITTLPPAGKATVAGPDNTFVYTAIGIGKTQASITFHYTDVQGNKNSVNKSFVFTILK
ncbi:MAG: hypothetical protein ABJB76_04265 [Candidatus Nitrosocosmicus sp.]